MRSLRRPAIVPPTLRPEGPGGKEHARNVARFDVEADRFAVDPEQPAKRLAPTFADHWLRPDVRGAIRGFQGHVCAFCGQVLLRGNAGDVEHFRPKSAVDGAADHDGYWWLAYAFDNYLLACRTCNSSCKRTKFPIVDQAQRRTFATRVDRATEPRLLWDPCVDDLDGALQVDIGSELVAVSVRSGCAPAQRDRMVASLGFFHINDDTSLIRARLDALDKALELADRSDYDGLRAMAAPTEAHSIVARSVLAAYAPLEATDITAEASVIQRWRGWNETIEILARIIDALAARAKVAEDDGDGAAARTTRATLEARQHERLELQWELAVARLNMPPAASAQLDALLAPTGCLDAVNRLAAEL